MAKSYDIAFKLGAKLNSSYNNAFQQAQNIADKTVSKILKTAAAIGGAVLSANTIKDTVEKAINYESAMADVAKVVDGLKDSTGKTTAAYTVMSDEILDMTARLPMAANEITQLIAAAGQSGIAADELTRFTEDAAKMGVAFDLPAEKAGELAAVIRSSLGLTQDEFVVLADKINYFGNTTTQSADKLIEVVQATGLIGKQAGVNADQIAAMSAAMNGMDAANMGTALSNIYGSLMTGSGATKAANKAWKSLGFTSSQVAKDMLKDSEGTMLKVFEAMQKLPKDQLSSTTAAIFGNNKSTKMAIASFTENLDALKQNFQDIGDATVYAGSMQNEFSSRAATTENKIQLAQNAIERLQITLGSKLLPVISDVTVAFADKMPGVIDKASEVMSKITFKVSKLWKEAQPIFNWIKSNPKTISTFFVNIGAAITAYKLASTIQNVVKSFQGMSFILSNPFALAITAVAVAISLIAVNVAKANRELKQANLSDHFGKISLSIQEVEDVSKRIIGNSNLDKIRESLNAYSELDNIQSSISGAVNEMNKLNWKVSIGLQLTENEQSRYIESVTSFISESQELLLQKQYALQLSLNVLAGDDANGQAIRDSVNRFYRDNQDELARLGTLMQDEVNNAFADGFLDIDEQKAIIELQSKMAQITEALAKSQYEAKLELFSLDFDGTELTGESFKALQNSMSNEMLAARESYDEARLMAVSNARAMLNQDAIGKAEYDNMIDTIQQNYLKNIGELETTATKFQFDTIMKAYEDELKTISPQFAALLEEATNSMIDGVNTEGFTVMMFEGAFQNISQFKGLDKQSKANLSDMFNNMQPAIDELEKLRTQYLAAEQDVSELDATITEMLQLGAMVGDSESIYKLMGQMVGDSSEFQELLTMFKADGCAIPEEFVTGIESKLSEVERSARAMSQSFMGTLREDLSKGLSVDVSVNASFQGNRPIFDPHRINLPGFAGGTDFSPETYIAGENGAELITNARGSKVFTAMETGRIFDNFTKISSFLSNLFTDEPSKLLRINDNTPIKGSSDGGITLQYSPNINVDGTGRNNNDIKQVIMQALEEDRHGLERFILDIMERVKSKEMRTSNE